MYSGKRRIISPTRHNSWIHNGDILTFKNGHIISIKNETGQECIRGIIETFVYPTLSDFHTVTGCITELVTNDTKLEQKMLMNKFGYKNKKEAEVTVKKLEPLHTAQNSFYNKAKVLDYGNGVYKLKSYDTIVSECINGIITHYGIWSRTTSRHQKEFELQYGK